MHLHGGCVFGIKHWGTVVREVRALLLGQWDRVFEILALLGHLASCIQAAAQPFLSLKRRVTHHKEMWL